MTEYLSGESLAARLNRGPLPIRKVIEYASQIAAGLAAAHENGVVHRDLKPANIYLTTDGRVKILDFGVAKLKGNPALAVDLDAATQKALTAPGIIMGSVGYMSPEQVRAENADHRSDIFSFGIVLYEMLSGKCAFRKDTWVESLNAILNEDPPDLTEVNDAVPPQLGSLVARCLEKRPDSRFQSANDLAFALDILSSSRVEYGPVTAKSARRRLSLIVRQHPVWTVASAILILALALLLYAFRIHPASVVKTSSLKSIAVLPLRSVGGDPSDDFLGLGVADAIITKVSQVADLTVRPTSAVRKYASVDSDALEAARQLQVDAVLDGTVQRSGNRLRVSFNLLRVSDGASLWAEAFDQNFTDIFAMQDKVAQQVAERLQRRLSNRDQERLARRETVSAVAYEYLLRGNYSFDKREFVATPDLEMAIAMFKKAIELDPNYALAYARLAYGFTWKALFTDIENPQWIELARDNLRRAESLNPNLVEISSVRFEIFWSRYERFNIPAAIRELRRGQEIDPNFGHENLGTILQHMGFEASRTELRRAMEIDPTSESIKGFLVQAHYQLGDYDEAIAANEKAFGDRGPAFALIRKQRFAEATESVNERLAKEPNDLRAQSTRIVLLTLAGKFREVEAMIPALDEKARDSRAYHHLTYDFACAYALEGKVREAVEWLSRTVEYGMPNYPLFDSDPLLARIRREPKFIEFMKNFKPRWDDLKREFGG